MRRNTLNSCLTKVAFEKFAVIVGLLLVLSPTFARAQGPEGKSFGFGLILGDPFGATVKYWTSSQNALVGDIGGSGDFGNPRIQVDYLWHFNAFRSNVVKMYAGPGLAIGFGREYSDFRYFRGEDQPNNPTTVGFGMRVMFGLNIIPRRLPLEIFAELGPLIEFSPGTGVALDGGVGIRFYP